MIKIIATILVCLGGLFSVVGGVRYLIRTEFTAYHAEVVGKNWSQIEPGIQTIILGMLTIVGSGFLATGVAILFLIIPIRRGEVWANWALLAVTFANWVPVLYVTFALRKVAPNAQTPIIPTIIIIALVVIGSILFFSKRTKSC